MIVTLDGVTLEDFVRILREAQERLTFSPTAHRYHLDSKPIPNVTTIIDMANKPLLNAWKVRVQQDADIAAAWEIIRTGINPGLTLEQFAERFKQDAGAQYEHERQSSEAKDIGRQVHHLIEKSVKDTLGVECEPYPGVISDDAQQLFSGVTDWMRQADFIPLAAESRCFSIKHWYAGTTDLPALVSGRKTIIDWKSRKYEGKKLWPEQEWQSCAYRMAFDEMGLGKWDGMILTLPKDGGKVMPVPVTVPIEKGFEAFLACRTLWAYGKKS